MKTSQTKINIAIGVATGLLVGFVLGIAYSFSSTQTLAVSGAQGNVSRLSQRRFPQTSRADTTSETIKLSATDSEGNNWEITLNKQ